MRPIDLDKLIQLAAKAAFITMTISAALHLAVSAVLAISRDDSIYFHPFHLLGLNHIVPPHIADSPEWFIFGWTILVGIGIVIFVYLTTRALRSHIKLGSKLQDLKIRFLDGA